MYNCHAGAVFGLSHPFLQLGYFRPQNKHPLYKNLYFAGASTHPGNGVPLVLLSAKLAVQRILEDDSASQAGEFVGKASSKLHTLRWLMASSPPVGIVLCIVACLLVWSLLTQVKI